MLVLNWVLAAFLMSPEPRPVVYYTFFLTQVSASNVESITSTGETLEGSFKKPVTYAAPEGGAPQEVTRFTTQRPTFANDSLFQQLQSTGVPINANPPDAGPPLWQQLLFGFGPTLLLLWLLFSVGRRAGGGAGGVLGSFGRSRATLYRPQSGPRTTFADVAGVDKVKSGSGPVRPGQEGRSGDLTRRRQILAVHTRDVPLAPDVDLAAVAAATPGMVGADLANLVNEAALLGARQVSSIARQMAGRWGMSEAVGPLTVLPPSGQAAPLGADPVGPATKELVDREARRIVDECHDQAVATLVAHRESSPVVHTGPVGLG